MRAKQVYWLDAKSILAEQLKGSVVSRGLPPHRLMLEWTSWKDISLNASVKLKAWNVHMGIMIGIRCILKCSLRLVTVFEPLGFDVDLRSPWIYIVLDNLTNN
jgi:hypothetical protein